MGCNYYLVKYATFKAAASDEWFSTELERHPIWYQGLRSDEMTAGEEMEKEMRQRTPATKILMTDGKWSESVTIERQAEWAATLSELADLEEFEYLVEFEDFKKLKNLEDPLQLHDVQIKWTANKRC